MAEQESSKQETERAEDNNRSSNNDITHDVNTTKLSLRFRNLSVVDPFVCTLTSLTSLDLSNNRVHFLLLLFFLFFF